SQADPLSSRSLTAYAPLLEAFSVDTAHGHSRTRTNASPSAAAFTTLPSSLCEPPSSVATATLLISSQYASAPTANVTPPPASLATSNTPSTEIAPSLPARISRVVMPTRLPWTTTVPAATLAFGV